METSNNVEFTFTVAVLRNPVFLQNFAAHEIFTFKLVCKSWKAWFVHYATTTMRHARRQDDTRDWYFPLFGKMEELHLGISKLAGMWHDNAQISSTSKLRNFASILKPGIEDLVDSAGGLLLFGTGSALVVTNPLTKLSKELPACDGNLVNEFLPCSAQQLLMVDELTNTYKVIHFWCTQSKLLVYDSRSNIWGNVLQIQPLVQPLLGLGNTFLGSRIALSFNKFKRIYSAICTRGRLYLADMRPGTHMETNMDPLLVGVIRLLEVDIGTGQGTLCNEFPIWRVFFSSDLHHLAYSNPLEYELSLHYNLELVECMGYLYAVIPSWQNEYLYHPKRYKADECVLGSEYFPLFHIIQLEGDVGAQGVLRIDAPNKYMDIVYRSQLRLRTGEKFFSCTAKGSVIWVSIGTVQFRPSSTFILQYDVLSRECFTEVVDEPQGKTLGLAYRASFHMKP